MNKRHSLTPLLIPCMFILITACGPSETTKTPQPTNTPEPVDMTEADLVFYNGVVLTMEPGQPQAQAVAILGDEILDVGSNGRIMAHVGPETQAIDLGGRTLVPGFIDSHAHWIGDNERTG